MNIKRAKQEIKDAVQAYLMKDEYGEYRFPGNPSETDPSDGTSGNWKNTDHGTDRKRM